MSDFRSGRIDLLLGHTGARRRAGACRSTRRRLGLMCERSCGIVVCMELAGKDPRLVAIVERLREDLGSGYFHLVDHWDGDLLAIGLGKPDAPGVLVYLAVAPDRDDLFFECETPAGELYEVAAAQEHAKYEDVLRVVAGHLQAGTRSES